MYPNVHTSIFTKSETSEIIWSGAVLFTANEAEAQKVGCFVL